MAKELSTTEAAFLRQFSRRLAPVVIAEPPMPPPVDRSTYTVEDAGWAGCGVMED